MGSYFQVLFVMRLDKDFLNVAKDDMLGRKIQDAGLLTKQRLQEEMEIKNGKKVDLPRN